MWSNTTLQLAFKLRCLRGPHVQECIQSNRQCHCLVLLRLFTRSYVATLSLPQSRKICPLRHWLWCREEQQRAGKNGEGDQ